ncbi:LacI family DNA-binding transcriptional regulator [Hymenobacter edaphi]|uniref:LacI family transcriptional regulator n=1 Tax=Hymenobacter edaphi TaxID=2211146 RepID=A0A328B5C4_9BACT|nr:LacI family DNA-binding transcriptional regulator [Hymenobacter edaphi]RAK62069.1 LacI family transcriptional regulator [Hymenobacter edaphi]
MITIVDLAEQLNLSPSTVSRALAGKSDIGTSTAQRVRDLAQQLGYRPNGSAVSLRRGKSKTLGVITPHLSNNFFAEILTGIEAAASREGYQVLVCQSNDDAAQEQRHLELLLRAQVDGILLSLARTTRSPQPFNQLGQRPVPIVFFDRYLTGDSRHAVVIDDYAAGYRATCHLLEQGYRHIVHVTGPQHLSIYHQRRRGYEQALRQQGLASSLLIAGSLKLADGVAAARQLLAATPRPDAIFAASDFAALGILQVLKERKIEVPQQMGLVGCSNELVSQFTEPALTTIDQHGETIGQQATRLLLQLLQNTDSAVKPLQIVLSPTLHVRASSSRPPHAR